MITCHPKKIPKFLLKGGVVQFCPKQEQEEVVAPVVVEKVDIAPIVVEEVKPEASGTAPSA